MAGETVYADLNIGPGKRCGKLQSLPQPGTSGCPRWHRTALWAAWTGNLLLGVGVVAMGCSFLHRQPENPETCKNGSGNGNVGDGNTNLENITLELRKGLCLSKLQEGEGCKLCPMGWTLHGTKCYWVAEGVKPWRESREDCVNQGAELLMPGHQAELGFVKKMVQKPTGYFWIGLSIPSAGKGWTWLNGSPLDQSRFQLSPGNGSRACGAVREDRISSESCSSGLPWICQKEATQL
ncbi:killer cell lectin-like receptor subfamily B member 1B allele C isoform 5-T5 [Theristicus caerulescens]